MAERPKKRVIIRRRRRIVTRPRKIVEKRPPPTAPRRRITRAPVRRVVERPGAIAMARRAKIRRDIPPVPVIPRETPEEAAARRVIEEAAIAEEAAAIAVMTEAEARKTDVYQQAVLADKEYLSRALGIPAASVTQEMIEGLGAASYSKRALTFLTKGELPARVIRDREVIEEPLRALTTPMEEGFVSVQVGRGGFERYYEQVAVQKSEFEQLTGREFTMEEYLALAKAQTPVEVVGGVGPLRGRKPPPEGVPIEPVIPGPPRVPPGASAKEAVAIADQAAAQAKEFYQPPTTLEFLRPSAPPGLDVLLPGGEVSMVATYKAAQVKTSSALIEKYPEKLRILGAEGFQVPFVGEVQPYMGMTKGEALALVAREYGLTAKQVEELPVGLVQMKAVEIESSARVEQLQEQEIEKTGIAGEFKKFSSDVLVFYPAKITTTLGIGFGTAIAAAQTKVLGREPEAEAVFFEQQVADDH